MKKANKCSLFLVCFLICFDVMTSILYSSVYFCDSDDSVVIGDNPIKSGIIIETSEDFSKGTLDNLIIDDLGYMVLDKGSYSQKWKEITPSSNIGDRAGHSIVFDSKDNVFIAFGGNDGVQYCSDTWIYTLMTNSWVNANPSSNPKKRGGSSVVYDSNNDKTFLFGGYSGSVFYNDTWIYDYSSNSWSEKITAVSPSNRSGASIIYDSKTNKIVLFGGGISGTYYNDTLIYDLSLNIWINMTPSLAPSRRTGASMVYDTENEKSILFGGLGDEGGNVYYNDTWVYDVSTNSWTELTPINRPTNKYAASMSYMENVGKSVLLGGWNGTSVINDTWYYDYSINTWTELDIITRPHIGYMFSAAYDSQNDKLLAYGGMLPSPPVYFDETWVLSLQDYATTGTFLSQIIDLEGIYNIAGTVSWSPVNQPVGTATNFQIGFSNTTSDGDFAYTSDYTSEFSFSALSRYLRYRATFESDSDKIFTPYLERVTNEYSLEKPKPEISVLNLHNGSIVKDTVEIGATAISPNGIEKVCFYIDGGLIFCDSDAPYNYIWESNTTISNNATIMVSATTVLGEEDFVYVSLILNNSAASNPEIDDLKNQFNQFSIFMLLLLITSICVGGVAIVMTFLNGKRTPEKVFKKLKADKSFFPKKKKDSESRYKPTDAKPSKLDSRLSESEEQGKDKKVIEEGVDKNQEESNLKPPEKEPKYKF